MTPVLSPSPLHQRIQYCAAVHLTCWLINNYELGEIIYMETILSKRRNLEATPTSLECNSYSGPKSRRRAWLSRFSVSMYCILYLFYYYFFLINCTYFISLVLMYLYFVLLYLMVFYFILFIFEWKKGFWCGLINSTSRDRNGVISRVLHGFC